MCHLPSDYFVDHNWVTQSEPASLCHSHTTSCFLRPHHDRRKHRTIVHVQVRPRLTVSKVFLALTAKGKRARPRQIVFAMCSLSPTLLRANIVSAPPWSRVTVP